MADEPSAPGPLKPDAATIDRICELLFNAASLAQEEHVVQFRAEQDPELNLLYFSIIVSADLFPPELRARITPQVERQVTAFFRDLAVVVKPVEDEEWGKCYEIDLPGELRGASWDEVSGRRRRPEAQR